MFHRSRCCSQESRDPGDDHPGRAVGGQLLQHSEPTEQQAQHLQHPPHSQHAQASLRGCGRRVALTVDLAVRSEMTSPSPDARGRATDRTFLAGKAVAFIHVFPIWAGLSAKSEANSRAVRGRVIERARR